ncbi:hypothetical protein [Nonomuraea sp. SBT364]|uniref:hypothetical protein n=1 Tax=Nonomuraea sp. SBT364 TaxID=1580530 RepID=UPI00066EE364|nr:hypothetical protein [Nonomuraea sp. SBT364]
MRAVPSDASVRLHQLAVRQEGDEWIVGRVDTGVFVALPEVGVRVIEMLTDGMSVEGVAEALEARHGEPVDVSGFVGSLKRLGFVAADHEDAPEVQAPSRSSFDRVAPRHVRWLLHPALGWGVLSLLVGCAVLMAAGVARIPTATEIIWSPWSSLVVLSQALLAWSVIFLHELGHLLTARAAGVPGRISLGTRLQFLVAQTDVSGIWAASRRTRMTVYLSGMAINGVLGVVGLALYNVSDPGPLHVFAATLYITQVLMLGTQFMFFMRTDIYFVVQDLARCRNLYGDASAYVRHVLGAVVRRGGADPSRALPARERRAVRLYAAFVVPGTAVCLGVFLFVTLPIAVGMIEQTYGNLRHATSAADVADALTMIAVFGFFQFLWVRTWWARHGRRVRAFLGRVG